MTTYPTYLKFGDDQEQLYRNLSSDQARDERFAMEEIDLRFSHSNKLYRIDHKYEAPVYSDGSYYYVLKEYNASAQ